MTTVEASQVLQVGRGQLTSNVQMKMNNTCIFINLGFFNKTEGNYVI